MQYRNSVVKVSVDRTTVDDDVVVAVVDDVPILYASLSLCAWWKWEHAREKRNIARQYFPTKHCPKTTKQKNILFVLFQGPQRLGRF